MTTFPWPACWHKNDIDSENCEACGISFFADGEDLSPTSLRAAAGSTEENKTTVRNRYDAYHHGRLAGGAAMLADELKAYGLDPTALNREDLRQPAPLRIRSRSQTRRMALHRRHLRRLSWCEEEPQSPVSTWTKVGMYLWALAKAFANTPQGPPGSGA